MLRTLLAAVLIALPAAAATRDRQDGVEVVTRLDAAALPAGLHRLWFRAGDSRTGGAWLVPVIVVRGARPGPKLLITAAIHGDELNGIAVIHALAARLDPATFAGTLTMVPGLNAPGVLHSTRAFTPAGGDGGSNLNRLMPGKPGGDAAERYAAALWSGLLRPNAETAIDLHTQSRGTAYVLYAFASTPRARAIAELAGPDIIKLDTGVDGTVENEMVRDGVPAITLELSRPEVFQPDMTRRGVDGMLRVMADLTMIAAAPPRTVTPFVGNKLAEVTAGRGGFATLAVELGAAVTKGAIVATIADPFGRTVETIRAPESGRVNAIATDPRTAPGAMLLRIVFASPDPACANGC